MTQVTFMLRLLALLTLLMYGTPPAAAQPGGPPKPSPGSVSSPSVATLAVTTASARVALPASIVSYPWALLLNDGASEIFVAIGDNTVTAVTTNYAIPAGRNYAVFLQPGNTSVAAITASSTSTLRVSQWNGQPWAGGGGGLGGVIGSTTAGNVLCSIGNGQVQDCSQAVAGTINVPIGLKSTQTVNFGAGADSSAANSVFFFRNNATGNCTGISTQCVINTFQVLDSVQDTGAQSVLDYHFNVGWGGDSFQASRFAVEIDGILNGSVSVTGDHQYTALGSRAAASVNAGGVTGGPYVGAMFGFNPRCNLTAGPGSTPGATFFNQCVGMEIDVSVDILASVNQEIGQQIVKTIGDVSVPFDASYGLSFNNQADVGGNVRGWDFLITDGGGAGFQGLNATGVFLSCRPHAGSSTCPGIGSFADLNNYVSITDWILRGPGGNGSIDGSFNVNAASYAVGGVSGVTKTCGATIVATHGIITSC